MPAKLPLRVPLQFGALDLALQFKAGGLKVTSVSSRGKYLRIWFGNDGCLESHFKFTGWWQLDWVDTVKRDFLHPVERYNINRYARYGLWCEKGKMLFTDPRGLGRLAYYRSFMSAEANSPVKNLGVEVSSTDFSLSVFSRIIARAGKKAICDVLIDQSKMAGLGSYLRCEILYLARLNPFRLCETLTEEEFRTLYAKILAVYQTAREGKDMTWWNVFRRDIVYDQGMKYEVMRTPWKGRGVYWVPDVQK